jgi:large subunit ribosomal protein L15
MSARSPCIAIGVSSVFMLHSLRPASGSTKKRKRVARGNSAGGGTTAGRGTKGQQARAGKGRRFGFEGGQMPLLVRQPKQHGFKQPRRPVYESLTLAMLEKKLPEGTYTLADLIDRRLVHANRPVKILSTGTLSKKLVIEAHAASKSAKEAITKAGGTLTIVPR